MPSKQSRARHAAPRDPSRTRVALPGLLLAAAGTAFAGLAAMPTAAAEPAARVTVAQALAPVELPTMELAPPPTANRALLDALQKGSEIASAPVPVPPTTPGPAPVPGPATAPVPAPVDPRVPAKASRDRSPAGVVATGSYARPGAGSLTSSYGRRWGRQHAGIDLASGPGSPIRAVDEGTVRVGCGSGYGNCVTVVHPDGAVTLYAHMSSLMVNNGQRVGAGQQLGREGATGNVTGVHLHFEVSINSTPVNPAAWLAARGVKV